MSPVSKMGASMGTLTDRLQAAWQTFTTLPMLASHDRLASRTQGYQAQHALWQACQEPSYGWKIAATSLAGQQHIGVSGPLAGRLLPSRRLAPGSSLSLRGNVMRVMEAEFAFRLGADVSQNKDWSMKDVMACVEALHLAIEIPNSRYTGFEQVGEACLIADFACAGHVVMGHEATAPWRDKDLSQHAVQVLRGDQAVAQGVGANVLGDPRIALTWLANELLANGMHLKQGDWVITGTCVVPVPVSEGDAMCADFGDLGQLSVQFTA
jgi:2-keto-4-pentenoate hydratase